MNRLENRLHQLLDREDIRDLLISHARALDRHDAAELVKTYHPEALEDHGAFFGPAEILAGRSGAEHAAFCKSHTHYLTNQTIDIDGDVAHAETYFFAGLFRKDGLTEMVGGRYIDRLERRSGRWAIAERACVVEWNGELAASQSPFDKDSFLQGRWNRDDLSYCRPLSLKPRPGEE